MSKVLIALSLAVIATVVACGGGVPRMNVGPQITVEEYAAACAAAGKNMDVLDGVDEDFASRFDALEDAVADMKRWNAPGELQ